MTAGYAQPRPLGRTALQVSPICIGTSPLAGAPALYGYDVGPEQAEATIRAVRAGPFNFMDTSNGYGGGEAERRIGSVLRADGGLPDGFVLATKADADPVSGDFSAGRVRQSVTESLERLGLDRIQLMYLHDPEYHISFEAAMAPGGPVEALADLRDQGVLGHLGIAAGPVGLLRQFLATGAFDAVISHNRFTLIDRSAEPLMDDAARLGVAFVNGAPYGGGILAKGPQTQPRYAYRPADDRVLAAVTAMQQACGRYGVPLRAAALQFSVRDPRVVATIAGVSDPSRIGDLCDLLDRGIPDELWAELDDLATPPDRWLD